MTGGMRNYSNPYWSGQSAYPKNTWSLPGYFFITTTVTPVQVYSLWFTGVTGFCLFSKDVWATLLSYVSEPQTIYQSWPLFHKFRLSRAPDYVSSLTTLSQIQTFGVGPYLQGLSRFCLRNWLVYVFFPCVNYVVWSCAWCSYRRLCVAGSWRSSSPAFEHGSSVARECGG